MNLNIFLLVMMANLSVSYGSILDSFSSFSPEKKIYAQSQKTYEKFKENFTKKLLQKEITTEESKDKLIEGFRDAGAEKQMKEFLEKGGDAEDPQIYLGKLAFMYTAQNKANFAAAMSLIKVCGAENFISSKDNPSVCTTYSQYMIKLIELRIGVITSRILYSSGIVGIPRGWIEHVQNMIKDLENVGMLSDSLRHLLYLLRGVAQNNEEIDTSILPNLLTPKTLSRADYESNSTLFNHEQHHAQLQQPIIIAPPPPQKISIDARNLVNHSSTEHALDSMMRQMMDKMLI
jgi:hypothetical protein